MVGGNEGYHPSEDEISDAEERMSDEQLKKSESREFRHRTDELILQQGVDRLRRDMGELRMGVVYRYKDPEGHPDRSEDRKSEIKLPSSTFLTIPEHMDIDECLKTTVDQMNLENFDRDSGILGEKNGWRIRFEPWGDNQILCKYEKI